jgi:hypothetical protein
MLPSPGFMPRSFVKLNRTEEQRLETLTPRPDAHPFPSSRWRSWLPESCRGNCCARDGQSAFPSWLPACATSLWPGRRFGRNRAVQPSVFCSGGASGHRGTREKSPYRIADSLFHRARLSLVIPMSVVNTTKVSLVSFRSRTARAPGPLRHPRQRTSLPRFTAPGRVRETDPR